MDVYVYYRVPVDGAAILQRKVCDMQSTLLQQFALLDALAQSPAAPAAASERGAESIAGAAGSSDAAVPPAAGRQFTAALKRRPEPEQERYTFMEVYAAIPEGFAAMLEQAVQDAGMAHLIDGARHAEIFMDVTPCV